MTELNKVPLLIAPNELATLRTGDVVLHNVPFFFDISCTGGALQVGLEPHEREEAAKCDIAVSVENSGDSHAVTVAKTDGSPFVIEYSDGDHFRGPAISRAVKSLRFIETSDSPWLSMQTPDDEPITITEKEGLNYLLQVLTLFVERAQKAEESRQAKEALRWIAHTLSSKIWKDPGMSGIINPETGGEFACKKSHQTFGSMVTPNRRSTSMSQYSRKVKSYTPSTIQKALNKV